MRIEGHLDPVGDHFPVLDFHVQALMHLKRVVLEAARPRVEIGDAASIRASELTAAGESCLPRSEPRLGHLSQPQIALMNAD